MKAFLEFWSISPPKLFVAQNFSPGPEIESFFPDTVRELLTHVPASVKSEQPTNPNYAITKDLAGESNLTALHMAAYSGSENVVRALLNSSGVDVEGGCVPSVSIQIYRKYNPLFI